MKNCLLLTFVAAVSLAGFAKEVTTNVETAGTLKDLIPADDKYTVTDLTVTGDLNAADILFIREMTGLNKKNVETAGVLENLDMGGANIVEGGGYYIDYLNTDWYVTIQMPTQTNWVTYEMFGPKLKKIVLPTSAEAIDPQAFTKCTALEEVEITGNSVYKSVDNVIMDLDEEAIVFYPAGKTSESFTFPATVTQVLDYAFQNNKNLKNVTLSNSLNKIGEGAFYNCKGITKMIIPDSVTELGGSAFYSCSGITEITFPASLEMIPSYVCTYCTSLKTINWPADLKIIDEFAFYAITAPTLNLPEGLEEIRTWAFERTPELKEVNFPSTLTKLGDCVFALSGVENIRLPEGLVQMDEMCFQKCKQLKSISLPSTLTFLDNQVVAYCEALKDIWCYAPVPPESSMKYFQNDLYATAFYCMHDNNTDMNMDFETVTVHVPNGTSEAYKVANGWNMFKNFVEFDPTGIDGVTPDADCVPVDYYDINGVRLTSPAKGLNIVKMSDGSVKKVLVR